MSTLGLWTLILFGQAIFLCLGIGWLWPFLVGYFYVQAVRETNNAR